MSPDDQAVDELHAVRRLFGKPFKDLNPDTRFGPAIEPIVDVDERAVTLGQIAPRRSGAQNPEDTVQHPPVIDPRHTARFARKKRLDQPVLEVHKVKTRHARTLSRKQ